MAPVPRRISDVDRLGRLEEQHRTAAIRQCRTPRPAELRDLIRRDVVATSLEGNVSLVAFTILTAAITTAAVAVTSPWIGAPSGALVGALATILGRHRLAHALRNARRRLS